MNLATRLFLPFAALSALAAPAFAQSLRIPTDSVPAIEVAKQSGWKENYDDYGNLSETNSGDGVVRRLSYDTEHRLKSSKSGQANSNEERVFSYEYDDQGRMKKQTQADGGSAVGGPAEGASSWLRCRMCTPSPRAACTPVMRGPQPAPAWVDEAGAWPAAWG